VYVGIARLEARRAFEGVNRILKLLRFVMREADFVKVRGSRRRAAVTSASLRDLGRYAGLILFVASWLRGCVSDACFGVRFGGRIIVGGRGRGAGICRRGAALRLLVLRLLVLLLLCGWRRRLLVCVGGFFGSLNAVFLWRGLFLRGADGQAEGQQKNQDGENFLHHAINLDII
jgi:hypothetical protein